MSLLIQLHTHTHTLENFSWVWEKSRNLKMRQIIYICRVIHKLILIDECDVRNQ